MKRQLLTVLILTALLLLAAMTVYAQEPEGGYTILIPLPVPQPVEVPPGVASAEAYTRHSAKAMLERLGQLQGEGRVDGFELLLDEHAIRVAATDPEELRDLDRDEPVLSVDEGGLACAVKGAKAVEDVLEAARHTEMVPAIPQATNPSIVVYYSGNYGHVWGQTGPDTPVQMVLKDASGVLKATDTVTSTSYGTYSFYPDWQTCLGYDWYPEPGDTVEVTAAGNPVSAEVAEISAVPDPAAGVVSGQTTPGRSVEIVGDSTATDCEYTGYSAEVTSDATGHFSATIDGGFDRSVSPAVYVYDTNENATYTYFYPPRIELDDGGNPSGHMRPEVSYTAALIRGESPVATFSGMTGEWGEYGGSFGETAQAGDVIEISGGGQVISTTFFTLNDLTVDREQDRIRGNVGGLAASRWMRVSMRRPLHACTYDTSCATDVVAGDGGFAFDFGGEDFDLQRGDEGSLTVFDEEGNSQALRDRLVVPVVEVVPYDDNVEGYWREPGVVVTTTLRDSDGAVQGRDSDTTSSYDGGFRTYFWSVSFEPGDRVDVSDGTYTLTVSSVPTLTTYLDAAGNTVSGEGPEGSVLALQPYQFRSEASYDGWTNWLCYTDTVSGSVYGVDLGSQFEARARDYAIARYTTSEGHRVSSRSYAFTVDVEAGGDRVHGYTPAPGTDVVVELWRGGSARGVFTATSSSSGSYSGSLQNGTPVTISQGDTVTVKADGIPTYSLSIPELTAEEDPVRNEVAGRAPAQATVKVELNQPVTWYDWGVLTAADADGGYVADFDGVYYWDCTEAEVGACTRPKATYYNDEGHSVYVWGAEPAPVAADGYEPDGVYTEAVPYEGIQSHSFHAVTDTDWISFTVGATDVGRPYYLETRNLGLNANTEMELYDTDSTTLLASDTRFSPAASEIVWTPNTTGTYYVAVSPRWSNNAVDCGSTYDFVIGRHRVYLPLVMRGR